MSGVIDVRALRQFKEKARRHIPSFCAEAKF